MSDVEPRLTYRRVKLALLSAAAAGGGRAALLDSALDGRRDPLERGMAEDALRQLLEDDLIRFNGSGLAETILTEAGRFARESGCLDALDRRLHALDPRMIACRAAAWEAVATGGARQLAAGMAAVAFILDGLVGATPPPLPPRAERALALVRCLLDQAEAPSAQDLADAIRVTEIVVRALPNVEDGHAARA